MKTALEYTLELLAEAENSAASLVLSRAVEGHDRTTAEGCLRALLRRHEETAHDDLIARWHTLPERRRAICAEFPGVLTRAIRAAFESTDELRMRNACGAAVMVRDYDSVPLFLRGIDGTDSIRSQVAADAVLRLADALYEETHERRDYRNRRDPQAVRNFVDAALETALARFSSHRNRFVLEAFILAAKRENAALKQVLNNVEEAPHAAAEEIFRKSTRIGVLRLLLSYLNDPRAPLSALQWIVRRTDIAFVRQLCRKLSDDDCSVIDANLARIDDIPWLTETSDLPLALHEAEQVGMVRLLMKSRAPRGKVRSTLLRLLTKAGERGKQAIIAGLSEFEDSEIDRYFLQWLEDPSSAVQAEAIRHVRKRLLPEALPILIDRLGSPSAEVREAVQEALAEFQFERFIQRFETIAPKMMRASILLLKRVNPRLSDNLAIELESRARARRLRALKIAELCNMATPLETEVLALIDEDDRAIREAAVRTAIAIGSPRALDRLRTLRNDDDPAIRDLAISASGPLEEPSPLAATSGGA